MLFIEGMLASSRGYPLLFLKRIMRSLTSTWINVEKTDLIFLPKGSTSEFHTFCSCCTCAHCISWPSSVNSFLPREKIALFLVKVFRLLLFLTLLIWMFLVLYGTLNLWWLCTGVEMWGFCWFCFGLVSFWLLSHGWEDKDQNAQLSWQKCVRFLWKPYSYYSASCVGWTFIHLSLLSVSLCAKESLTSSGSTVYKPLH